VNLSLPFDDLALEANARLLRPGAAAESRAGPAAPELGRSPARFQADALPEPAAAGVSPFTGTAIGEATEEACPVPDRPILDRPAPEDLHPALWRAAQLGGGLQPATPSGFAALDAELPGGGWPHSMLTELLLPHAGVGELRLLAPALARLAGSGRCVMFFDPPARLHAPALAALGLSLHMRHAPQPFAYI